MQEQKKSVQDGFAGLSSGAQWACGLGLGLLLLVVVASFRSRPPAPPAGYPGYYPMPVVHAPAPMYPPPTGGSPADRWLNGNEFRGRISSGTIDRSGQGNHVIGVGGKVLSLP